MSFETIRMAEVKSYINKENVTIVDVRNEIEFARGHIEGAINIPYEKLEERKIELKEFHTIVLYCDRGNMSLLAARDLCKAGFSVVNLCGGLRAYRGNLVK